MNNLNKKQKIILGIISVIIMCAIGYYVYAKDESIEQVEENQLQIEENKTTNEEEVYSDDTIKIHISGEINKEGIVELKPNSRLADAIDKAGGVKENADTDKINLAYILEDGMKIRIPNKNEKNVKENNEQISNNKDITDSYISKSSGVVTNENNNEEGNKTSKVNINTATQTELETLPGIGPSTASKIIAYRKEKGKFKNIEELKDVSGIGNSKYDKVKDLISVK